MLYARQFHYFCHTLFICCLLKMGTLLAAEQQFINQQERQKALAEQLTPQAPDIHLLTTNTLEKQASHLIFPQEQPCFNIKQIWLENADKMPFYLALTRLAKQGEQHCLGSQGINLLMSQLQNRLVEHGYTTSRILAPAQNLTTGKLHLLLLAGKIHQVRLSADSGRYLQLYSSFPAHAGNLLNLRDIEQGLERLY